jgi:peptidoglycan/LPS O-acetylase OafA/YrhL
MQQAGSGAKPKLGELESVRGVAAFAVVIHHFLMAYTPHFHGRLYPDDPIALVRTPFFAFVNGSAAVSIFFVLSGFVLTFSALKRRDLTSIFRSSIKRWPRLAMLIVLVNIASGLFLYFGLYTHQNRAWLDPATYAGLVSILKYAIREGGFETFIHGNASLNASI